MALCSSGIAPELRLVEIRRKKVLTSRACQTVQSPSLLIFRRRAWACSCLVMAALSDAVRARLLGFTLTDVMERRAFRMARLTDQTSQS